MTTAMKAKADRFANEGRVKYLIGAEVLAVQGDRDVYLVVLHNGAATCTCPATGPCSHIQAAMQR